MKNKKHQTKSQAFAIKKVKAAGLQLTRHRVAIAARLFRGPDRHITAEQLYSEMNSDEVKVSLATVYNTLNQFTKAGLLRELAVNSHRSYFDTNIDKHHHFFFEESGKLEDVPEQNLHIEKLPKPPLGTQISSVGVIIRLSKL